MFVKTGMRSAELSHLTWDDILADEKMIRITNQREGGGSTKNYRVRHVPMDGDLQRVLEAQPRLRGCPYVFATRDGRLRQYNLITNIRKFGERAGIPRLTVHELRHTYASLQLRAGTTLVELKTLLGHADIKTTMRYIHLTLSDIQRTAERIQLRPEPEARPRTIQPEQGTGG